MPELPEVHTVVSDLREAGLVGATLGRVRVTWPRTIATHPVESFRKQVQGATILELRRRAKFVVFSLSNSRWLYVHLRMTGSFHVGTSRTDPHDLVTIELNDRRVVAYHDPRKFGRWFLIEDPSAFEARLGPEPLEPSFTAPVLHSILTARHRMIKPLLLDQAAIAGLGNIYVDEALWEARIHPRTDSSRLTPSRSRSLHRAIRLVLERGIRNMGTTLGTGEGNFYSVSKRRGRNRDELKVFRRAGQACPRCGSTIERVVVGQRGTHVCSQCQPAPGVRAARGGHEKAG